jgi:hypothetical protein
MPLPLSKIEQDALAAFVPTEVATYVASGKFARVTFRSGKTIEHANFAIDDPAEIAAIFEQGLLAGVTMRAAEANELLEKLGAMFAASGKADPRSAMSAAANAIGFLQHMAGEIPAADEVIGEDSA